MENIHEFGMLRLICIVIDCSRGAYKRGHFISMSVSAMSLHLLHGAILIFTMVSRLSLAVPEGRFRPNTYWSKRSGEDNNLHINRQGPGLSNEIKDNMKLPFKKPWNVKKSSPLIGKLLLGYEVISLPFSTIIRQGKQGGGGAGEK